MVDLADSHGNGEAMRNLRKAVVVAAMVGGMGMFGAGVAAAGDHGKSGNGLGDFFVNNPQFKDCSYSGNTSTALTQTATAGGVEGDSDGAATNGATLGDMCVQTGPSFVG